MKRVLLLVLVGCGGGESNPQIDAPPGGIDAAVDASIDSPPAGFTITSPAFTEGMTIPTVHTCDGANTSPQLDWGPAPAGTMSLAVVHLDLSFNSFLHWVIFDIPASATGLPADVEKVFQPTDVPGAEQTLSFSGGVRGYLGPCPPALHTYEYRVYALDVATLPGATMNTTRAQAETLIKMHDLTSATLTGTYDRP